MVDRLRNEIKCLKMFLLYTCIIQNIRIILPLVCQFKVLRRASADDLLKLCSFTMNKQMKCIADVFL